MKFCKNGLHEMTGDNLRIRIRNGRAHKQCLACATIWEANRVRVGPKNKIKLRVVSNETRRKKERTLRDTRYSELQRVLEMPL